MITYGNFAACQPTSSRKEVYPSRAGVLIEGVSVELVTDHRNEKEVTRTVGTYIKHVVRLCAELCSEFFRTHALEFRQHVTCVCLYLTGLVACRTRVSPTLVHQPPSGLAGVFAGSPHIAIDVDL